MRRNPGEPAPAFEGTTLDGSVAKLADFSGRKLWLAFFRYAACPLCNLQVSRIIGRLDGLRAQGLELVAVFQSPQERVERYVGQQKPPFPIICDPEQRLYELYGVETSLAGFVDPRNVLALSEAFDAGFGLGEMDGAKTRLPADFLIGPDGTLETVFYARTIAEHIPLEVVERFAAGDRVAGPAPGAAGEQASAD